MVLRSRLELGEGVVARMRCAILGCPDDIAGKRNDIARQGCQRLATED